jgi:hypothetical protein
VKANGTRETKSGRRRDYRCYPVVGKPHNFPVIIDVSGRTMPSYSTPAECPTHGANGTVVRDGTYGPKGESLRRQKYRCTPNEPAEKAKYLKGVHYFTPPRAREHVHFGMDHCAECEEFRGVHRGEQVVARRQNWNLRVVAEGLSRLSAGESYSSVSRWALDSTGGNRTRPAKLSAAEKNRRAAVKAWRATLPRRKQGVAEPAPPTGVSLVALAGAHAAWLLVKMLTPEARRSRQGCQNRFQPRPGQPTADPPGSPSSRGRRWASRGPRTDRQGQRAPGWEHRPGVVRTALLPRRRGGPPGRRLPCPDQAGAIPDRSHRTRRSARSPSLPARHLCGEWHGCARCAEETPRQRACLTCHLSAIWVTDRLSLARGRRLDQIRQTACRNPNGAVGLSARPRM